MVDLSALPRSDRRILDRMAEAAGCSPEAMALQMAREYLGLARNVPDALPDNPLRRLTSASLRKSGV